MNICNKKAKEGDINGLHQARLDQYEWDTTTCWVAAKYGKLSCLKYAHENGCPWDIFTLIEAIKNKHYDCFLYALENGCPYTSMVTLYLARDGNVFLMEKCIRLGIPLHSCAIYEAIKYNHLALAKYLYFHTCTWDTDVSIAAVKYGNLDILEYVIQNNCPYYVDELVKKAIGNDHPHCVKWILQNLYQDLYYDDFIKIESYAISEQHYSLLLLLPFLNQIVELFLSQTRILHEHLPRDLVNLIYEYF